MQVLTLYLTLLAAGDLAEQTSPLPPLALAERRVAELAKCYDRLDLAAWESLGGEWQGQCLRARADAVGLELDWYHLILAAHGCPRNNSRYRRHGVTQGVKGEHGEALPSYSWVAGDEACGGLRPREAEALARKLLGEYRWMTRRWP